jgi:hypothetical protein
MMKNAILDLPLSTIFRTEIALPLQQLLRMRTVGQLLDAWRSPRNRRQIEQLFDSPQQARHAVAVCTAWLGFESRPLVQPTAAWWLEESREALNA